MPIVVEQCEPIQSVRVTAYREMLEGIARRVAGLWPQVGESPEINFGMNERAYEGLRELGGKTFGELAIEKQAKAGEIDIYSSALAIAEVVNHKASGVKMAEADIRMIGNYFRNKYIKIVPVDRIVAKNAADIVRNHGLMPPDAIHVATALRTKCEVLYTYDGDGAKPGLLQQNLKIGVPSISIKKPGEFGQMLIGMNPK